MNKKTYYFVTDNDELIDFYAVFDNKQEAEKYSFYLNACGDIAPDDPKTYVIGYEPDIEYDDMTMSIVATAYIDKKVLESKISNLPDGDINYIETDDIANVISYINYHSTEPVTAKFNKSEQYYTIRASIDYNFKNEDASMSSYLIKVTKMINEWIAKNIQQGLFKKYRDCHNNHECKCKTSKNKQDRQDKQDRQYSVAGFKNKTFTDIDDFEKFIDENPEIIDKFIEKKLKTLFDPFKRHFI